MLGRDSSSALSDDTSSEASRKTATIQTDHEACMGGGRGQESRAVTKEPTCTVRMVAL